MLSWVRAARSGSGASRPESTETLIRGERHPWNTKAVASRKGHPISCRQSRLRARTNWGTKVAGNLVLRLPNESRAFSSPNSVLVANGPG